MHIPIPSLSPGLRAQRPVSIVLPFQVTDEGFGDAEAASLRCLRWMWVMPCLGSDAWVQSPESPLRLLALWPEGVMFS